MNTPKPIPERLVVLTFDDAVSNHATFVGPLLKRHGFGATFYVCEFPPDFETNKQQYMTWEQIRELSDLGFEIGNHTGHHAGVTSLTQAQLEAELDFLDERCAEYGIPRPTTFCYPGCGVNPQAVAVLQARKYLFARIGDGRAYEPECDDPLLAPSFPVHGDDPAVFYKALQQATAGQVVVLMFHGVPEYTHPWVNTPPERFAEYMQHLADNLYTVIAMRDLVTYVSP